MPDIDGDPENRPGYPDVLDAPSSTGNGDDEIAALMSDEPMTREPLPVAEILQDWAPQNLNVVGRDKPKPPSIRGLLYSNTNHLIFQWERRIISQRTKDALAVKRAQGVRLGRPSVLPPELVERIVREHRDGSSLSAIARTLTAEGVPTAHGALKWWPATVPQAATRAGRSTPRGLTRS